MKDAITAAIKALAAKASDATTGYDAAQYGQAVNSLTNALSSLIYMEQQRGANASPEGEVETER